MRLPRSAVLGVPVCAHVDLGFIRHLLAGRQDSAGHRPAPEELRADPKLVPSAIEEVLRYVSPLQARPRISTRPFEVDGIAIPEGALGLAWLQSANRDPDAFKDPGRFDVQRSPNRHVAFGYGEHFCIGAWLARMEGRVALEEWLLGIERYRLADEGRLQWTQDFMVRGPSRLPVEVTAP